MLGVKEQLGVRAVQETMYREGKGPGLESAAPGTRTEGRGILWLALSAVGGAKDERPAALCSASGGGQATRGLWPRVAAQLQPPGCKFPWDGGWE